MANEFIDSSAGHTEVHTPTIIGAVIDTAYYKYGGGSGKFESTNNVTYPDSADWTFGNNPLTIGFWVYIPTPFSKTFNVKIVQRVDANNYWYVGVGKFIYDWTYSVFFGCTIGGVTRIRIGLEGVSMNSGWHHIEVSRDSASGYIFIDGIKQTLNNGNSYSGNMENISAVLTFGYIVSFSDNICYIDDVKIDKGICRHTSNFTSPTGEDVDNDAYTVLYLKCNASYVNIENLVLADSIVFADYVNKDTILNLFQPLSFSDSLSKSSIKNLLSNLGLVDSRSSTLRKVLNNNIYFTDDFQRLGLRQLLLSSALSLYDNISKRPTKNINDDLYIADYNRFRVAKNIFDSFGFKELFMSTIEGMSYAVLYILDDRLGLIDKVEKTARKILSDWLDLHDQMTIYILEGDHNRKLYLWSNLSLVDSIAKRIVLVKQDGISLTATLGNDGYLSLQDTISLQDKIAFRVIKVLNETIQLTDEITQLLETEPFYFDDGKVEPYFVIEDLIVYGGAEMHFYPEQTVVIKWKTRYFTNDDLFDPDSFDISIYDPKNVKRVVYNSTYLVKDSVGVFKYTFNIPSDVVEGDWCIKVRGTKGTWNTVLNIHLEVRKK